MQLHDIHILHQGLCFQDIISRNGIFQSACIHIFRFNISWLKLRVCQCVVFHVFSMRKRLGVSPLCELFDATFSIVSSLCIYFFEDAFRSDLATFSVSLLIVYRRAALQAIFQIHFPSNATSQSRYLLNSVIFSRKSMGPMRNTSSSFSFRSTNTG